MQTRRDGSTGADEAVAMIEPLPEAPMSPTPSPDQGAGLVERAGYGVLLGGSLGASWGLGAAGAPAWAQVSAVVAVAAALIWLWERVLPHTSVWRPHMQRLRLDVLHTLVSSGGTSRLIEITLLASLATLAPALGGDGLLWPTTWPLALQLAAALTIGELGAYWAHRAFHLTQIGWRIHAVHHSAEALHLWASGRTHPFNTALVFTAQSAGVVLLGAPPAVIALMAVFTGVNGLLQHANIRVRPGWLNAVVSTAEHHRWHHSRVLAESNTNFGNNLIIWDRVFGTYFAPRDRQPGDAVGITGTVIPEGFWHHWLTPFVLSRYETTKEQ
jgi:sterol desaturase/sphingolipid hydroxylase (fatty acid hydroxylase superfamily)